MNNDGLATVSLIPADEGQGRDDLRGAAGGCRAAPPEGQRPVPGGKIPWQNTLHTYLLGAPSCHGQQFPVTDSRSSILLLPQRSASTGAHRLQCCRGATPRRWGSTRWRCRTSTRTSWCSWRGRTPTGRTACACPSTSTWPRARSGWPTGTAPSGTAARWLPYLCMCCAQGAYLK